jgi:hypothetical protein
MNHALDLGKGRGGLHPVVLGAFEVFAKHRLHHLANKRIDIDYLPLGLMGPIMVRDTVAVIAVDPPDRDRWTDHLLRQVGRQTLIL